MDLIDFFGDDLRTFWRPPGPGSTTLLIGVRCCSAMSLFYWWVYLMCPTDKVKVVSVQEFADDVGPEGETHAAVVFSPTLNISELKNTGLFFSFSPPLNKYSFPALLRF